MSNNKGIDTGKKAPDFELCDKRGKRRKLSSLMKDFTVLYFYPKDNTPGCTIEAKEFNKKLSRFKRLKAAVVGISGGDQKSKQQFCKKHGLKVDLLSDSDFKVSKKFGAYGLKSFMGKKFKGILRKTFILDKKRKVVKVYDKVTPVDHADEVLNLLKSLSRS